MHPKRHRPDELHARHSQDAERCALRKGKHQLAGPPAIPRPPKNLHALLHAPFRIGHFNFAES
jgi:hypothetical protein